MNHIFQNNYDNKVNDYGKWSKVVSDWHENLPGNAVCLSGLLSISKVDMYCLCCLLQKKKKKKKKKKTLIEISQER